MNRLLRIKIFGLVGIVISAIVIAFIGVYYGLFTNIENRSWDWRAVRISSQGKPDKNIKLITIDQASLDYYSREEGITWPWPRSLYIPVIKFLESAGARGIAFDLLFTESSAQGVADDREYAEALKSKVPIVSSVVLRSQRQEKRDEGYDLFLKRQRDSEVHRPIGAKLRELAGTERYDDVTLPFPEILSNSALFGAVNGIADSDGIFRHVFFGGFLGELPILSLPLSLFHGTGASEKSPVSLSRDLTVRFHGPSGSYPEDNIVNIISSYVAMTEGKTPKINPQKFKDSFVLIGVDAPGLLDLRPTSLDKVFRGVEFNAATLDNLLHNDFIHKAPFAWGLVLTVIFSLFLSFGIIFSVHSRTHALIVLGCFLGFFYAEYLFALYGIWMPLAVPLISLLFVTILSLGFQYQLEGKEHRFIREAFGHYVSPKVIDKIVANPSTLALGGDRREVTIFFSDIAGFTSLSEKMEPTKLVSFLNFYLTEMTDIILASGGTLDKYEGDAIIAFWNAPLPVTDHSLQAVRAAKKCLEQLEKLRDVFLSKYDAFPYTRIGMHTGVVTVGNFGSKVRFDYTMIGDAANLASRMEGANKFFGTSYIISEEVLGRCRGEISSRYVGSLQVVGKNQVIKVFEPILMMHSFTETELSKFAGAVAAFERGALEEAYDLFGFLVDDPVSKKYIKRIETLGKKATEPWSYVWKLDEK